MPDYFVKIGEQEPTMVRAKNNIAARNHAVRTLVHVRTLTTEDAIALAGKGKKLEIAGDDVPASEAETGQEEQLQDGEGAGEVEAPQVESLDTPPPGSPERLDDAPLASGKTKTPKA